MLIAQHLSRGLLHAALTETAWRPQNLFSCPSPRPPEEKTELPANEAAELERLTAEREDLLDAEYDEDGEEDPAVASRLEAIEPRIAELEAMAHAWTPEQRTQAGAIVSLSQDGEPEVDRGLVRRDDQAAVPEPDDEVSEDEAPSSPAPALPATLVAELTARRTAALRATLAQSPDVALVAVTHALARCAFYEDGGESSVQVTLTTRDLRGVAETEGVAAFATLRAQWAAQLPADAGELWSWCIRQTQDTLLALMAVAAANAVDAVREKGTPEDADRLLHADALAKALGFDMRAWFQPTAANYFGRVKRDFITEALVEAGRPARTRTWAKMKKSDLAVLAERELHGTGWLPKPLRNPSESMQAGPEVTGTHAVAA